MPRASLVHRVEGWKEQEDEYDEWKKAKDAKDMAKEKEEKAKRAREEGGERIKKAAIAARQPSNNPLSIGPPSPKLKGTLDDFLMDSDEEEGLRDDVEALADGIKQVRHDDNDDDGVDDSDNDYVIGDKDDGGGALPSRLRPRSSRALTSTSFMRTATAMRTRTRRSLHLSQTLCKRQLPCQLPHPHLCLPLGLRRKRTI